MTKTKKSTQLLAAQGEHKVEKVDNKTLKSGHKNKRRRKVKDYSIEKITQIREKKKLKDYLKRQKNRPKPPPEVFKEQQKKSKYGCFCLF